MDVGRAVFVSLKKNLIDEFADGRFTVEIGKVIDLFNAGRDAYLGRHWDPRSRRWRDREGRFIAR